MMDFLLKMMDLAPTIQGTFRPSRSGCTRSWRARLRLELQWRRVAGGPSQLVQPRRLVQT